MFNGSSMTNPFRLRQEAQRSARAASSVADEEVRKLAERREAKAEANHLTQGSGLWVFPGEGLDNTFGHALRNNSLHNVFALCTV